MCLQRCQHINTVEKTKNEMYVSSDLILFINIVFFFIPDDAFR